MKLVNFPRIVVLTIFLTLLSINLLAQKNKASKPLMKSTSFKLEKIEFGAGGTISVVGAPTGSIQIEGWNKNEVEISAEIVVEATNENDLRKLAEVCGFIIDDSLSHLRITTVGTHDKKYLKKVSKKFPKRLRGAPYEVNYKIKVPVYSDLEISGGRGDFILSAVEGTMRITFLESNAKLNLIGGTVRATIGIGNVDVTVATRSWRGRSVEVKVASGKLNVWLPRNLNANLNARVLRTGKIANSYKLLKPMRRTKFTDKGMTAKAGNGGADLSFTIGDGILTIGDFEKIAKK